MQTRHTDRSLYFREQVQTTTRHLLPFIEKSGEIVSGFRILEVGCGEGGNLKPFLERGCYATGIDLSENKIALARSFYEDFQGKERLELIYGDIYDLPPSTGKFDLIFMRDVIEHIHDQERFMQFIKSFMHGTSRLVLAFPPWQNPFGGHQQICKNRILAKLPWFHLLPVQIYRWILRWGGESKATIESLEEIRDTRLSIERFEKIFKKTSYQQASRQLYLINPNYEVKFGLKPRKQPSLLAAIPFLRNFITTTVYYSLFIGQATPQD